MKQSGKHERRVWVQISNELCKSPYFSVFLHSEFRPGSQKFKRTFGGMCCFDGLASTFPTSLYSCQHNLFQISKVGSGWNALSQDFGIMVYWDYNCGGFEASIGNTPGMRRFVQLVFAASCLRFSRPSCKWVNLSRSHSCETHNMDVINTRFSAYSFSYIILSRLSKLLFSWFWKLNSVLQ
jgi:hypothetical protein